jgi:MFS family permease
VETIVATALPAIGEDLDDFAHLLWAVTAYLIAATVTVPIYGKLRTSTGGGAARRGAGLRAVLAYQRSLICAPSPAVA